MRLCQYIDESGGPAPGLLTPRGIVSLRPLLADHADLMHANGIDPASCLTLDLLPIGDALAVAIDTAKLDLVPVLSADTMLLPPVLPEKVFCIGLNYADHAAETGAEIPDTPVVFSKFNTALAAHQQPIELPAISERVDYEAELVVIIGNTCRYTPIDQAMNYVYGYCCGHDVSARDWQKGRAGGQWLLGKTFDTFGPLGPAAVHHSVVGDVASLRVQMRINGETMQDSTTSQLIFTVPELVSHLSQFCTLHPGDIIFTGTPPGVGAAKQPPRFLRDGDVCEVEIDGLGVLRNPVINAP